MHMIKTQGSQLQILRCICPVIIIYFCHEAVQKGTPMPVLFTLCLNASVTNNLEHKYITIHIFLCHFDSSSCGIRFTSNIFGNMCFGSKESLDSKVVCSAGASPIAPQNSALGLLFTFAEQVKLIT